MPTFTWHFWSLLYEFLLSLEVDDGYFFWSKVTMFCSAVLTWEHFWVCQWYFGVVCLSFLRFQTCLENKVLCSFFSLSNTAFKRATLFSDAFCHAYIYIYIYIYIYFCVFLRFYCCLEYDFLRGRVYSLWETFMFISQLQVSFVVWSVV